MATRNGLEEMDVNNGVEEWLERFEMWVSIQDAVISADTEPIRSSRTVAFLLSGIGAEAYRILKAYSAPELPHTKTYVVLKKVLMDNLAPPPSTISQTYKFSCLKQETAESMSLYMSRVKLAASKCDYGAAFDRMVKDKFICGIRSEKLRAHLINDVTINTAAAALAKALTRENSESAAHTMASNTNYVKVQSQRDRTSNSNQHHRNQYNNNNRHDNRNSNRGSRSSRGFNSKVCSKCTLKGHLAEDCRVKCRSCDAVGHIKSKCPKVKQRRRVNNVTEDDDWRGNATDNVTGDDQHMEHLWKVSLSDSGAVVSQREIECNFENICNSDDLNVIKFNVDLHDSINCNVHDTLHDDIIQCNLHDSINCDLHDTLHDDILQCVIDDKLPELINQVNVVSSNPTLDIMINGKHVSMEFDTGASVSVMSKLTFDKLHLTGAVLEHCDKVLTVANGQSVPSLFKTSVIVKYRGTHRQLCLYVVDGTFPALLGRDWISELFGDDWISRVIEVNSVVSVDEQRKRFVQSIQNSKIFDPGLGKVTGFKATLDLKPDYRPKFCKARTVPFALVEPIGKELDRMEREGILVKTDSSQFASPVVPVVKSDKSLRLCGDYKMTLNPNLDTKVYPLPVVEDCFKEMKGGVQFTKLDIKQAYNHICLREEDRTLTTINTHQGLYMWTRLPYGVSSSSAIFQSIMDTVLSGMAGVTCRVDDILVTGYTTEQHIQRVEEVARRLADAGFHCKWDKSEFLKERVKYLGYEISREGVKACRSKVETLAKAPYPTNLQELIAFLGAVQYYSRFIPQMSTLVEPLNRLRTAKEWKFDVEEQHSFDELKKILMSNQVLTFYDPDLPLRVDCDASSYGLGAVLSHVVDGIDRPIEFISRTLKSAERNYSQIEKEALSIVWSIKRFHRYLYARPFELYTDHKPLEFILHPNKQIPEMATSRIQRWAIILSAYQYTIKYRSTNKHCNADLCSRYPLPETDDEVMLGEAENVCSVFSLYMDDGKPLLNSELMAKFTKRDPVLAKVLYQVQEGWTDEKRPSSVPEKVTLLDEPAEDAKRPSSVPEKVTHSGDSSDKEYRSLYNRRCELSAEQGCVLWGNRVIVPSQLRRDMLILLHATHMGMTMMKKLARNYVWWPGLDVDIEFVVKGCETCQLNQRLPNKSVPHPWIKPQGPWERIHVDFAGPFKNNMWLLVSDSYSKWLEVINMKSNTKSANLIRQLRSLFSRYGLPKILVSDNGPQLVSNEFEQFCVKNGINHIPIPSYHPASNGQVEAYCGKFKRAMKKMCDDNVDMDLNIANWLINYHNTPHTSTGIEPSVLMIGRRLRSALSLVHPLSDARPMKRQVDQEKMIIEGEKTLRRFVVGDKVLFRNVLEGSWNHGVITSESDKQYKISTDDGSTALVRKHIDHVVSSTSSPVSATVESDRSPDAAYRPGLSVSDQPRPTRAPVISCNIPSIVSQNCEISGPSGSCTNKGSSEKSTPNSIPSATARPRPQRESKQPERWGYNKLGG